MTAIGWARWEDARDEPPRRLVAPHGSEVEPETPAGELGIPALTFTLAELRELFQVMEDGTYLPGEAPADGSTFSGVVISWRIGGQTTCATKDLPGVQKPADISTVEGRAGYADGSSLTVVLRPGRRGRRAVGRIQWTGIGEARERAQAMETYTDDLNHGTRKFLATLANLLCVDGRIARTKGKPDWVALSCLATIAGVFLTGLVALLTILLD